MDFHRNVLMEKYDFGRLLGQGSFAKVYHGKDLKSGQNVAIKVIDKDRVLKSGLIEQIKREISVMGIVKHPNVVQLYEVMATKTKIYFILEYIKGGDLFDKVSQGKLKESIARKYFLELISAIDVCHGRGVYHRDLKLENILIDENGNLKVTDFGLSALVESKQQDGLLHTTCGTPAYVAPEVIQRCGYDGVKADIWSCGVILYVMLAGYLPFRDTNIMEMYRKMSKGDYKCPNWFPSNLRKLLHKILDPNPYTRISISKIRNSSWFRKGTSSKSKSHRVESKEEAPSEVDSVVEKESEQELSKPVILNAFDLISFSSGLSLSGLFTENKEKDEVQFTSLKPIPVIILKLEEISREVNMRLVKKDKGLLRLEGLNEDSTGKLCIDVQLFEIALSFYAVEVKKMKGDAYEYHKILREIIRPALKDIVWAWQGEQQQQTATLETT